MNYLDIELYKKFIRLWYYILRILRLVIIKKINKN